MQVSIEDRVRHVAPNPLKFWEHTLCMLLYQHTQNCDRASWALKPMMYDFGSMIYR